jgi:hypothetical protein
MNSTLTGESVCRLQHFRYVLPPILVLAFVGLAPTQLCAQVTAESARTAIANGVAYLKRQQNDNGSWGEYPEHPGGVTSLCTLALLNAGLPADDPVVAKGLDYIRSVDRTNKSTYAASLMTMALCNATPERDIAIIRENVRWLEEAQITDGAASGGWAYRSQLSDRADNSNTQFALLALHEAALAGVEAEQNVWQRAREYWLGQQHASGGFGYVSGNLPSGSMTCAGISSLIIVEENLSEATPLVAGQLQCCGQQEYSLALDRAIEFWGTRFAARFNPTGPNDVGKHYLFYYLYGVERAGRLSGRRFFGDHDWYREGAEYILERQQPVSGAWVGTSQIAEGQGEIATSFALLFLSKGRWPVVAAKYEYGSDSQWDQNPKGLHQLVRQTEKSWEQKLTWQTINSKVASVNDLLQAPVLVLSGTNSLDLTTDQKQALQDYVNQGGFIFAWANQSSGCDATGFDRDFRELMTEIFPDSPLTVLEPTHPIWFADRPIQPSPDRPLLGIQACCRTSIVYCPSNLSCYWQAAHPTRQRTLPAALKNEVSESIQLGTNVLAYATGRNLQEKLDRPQVATTKISEERPRTHLELPKLTHEGGADEASRAWGNLLKATSQWLEQPISQQKLMIAPDDPRLGNFPIVFMHGRRAFKFSPDERESLAHFLGDEVQGFVVADSICGNKDFSASLRKEFSELIPGATWGRIPTDHPLMSQELRGFDLSQVSLRRPERSAEGVATFRETRTPPVLEGLWVDGRLAVVFSPYDISCALENGSSIECEGYSADDARRIGINILLYALQM